MTDSRNMRDYHVGKYAIELQACHVIEHDFHHTRRFTIAHHCGGWCCDAFTRRIVSHVASSCTRPFTFSVLSCIGTPFSYRNTICNDHA